MVQTALLLLDFYKFCFLGENPKGEPLRTCVSQKDSDQKVDTSKSIQLRCCRMTTAISFLKSVFINTEKGKLTLLLLKALTDAFLKKL